MKKLIRTIDRYLCKFIGLKEHAISLDQCYLQGNKLKISVHDCFKRHSHKKDSKDLLTTDLKQLSPEDKLKIGSALGQALANGLTISFDNIIVEN